MTESMSNLEKALRHQTGINIFLRNKLIKAYLGDNGMVEVPQLINDNKNLINDDILPGLIALAQNEDAEITPDLNAVFNDPSALRF